MKKSIIISATVTILACIANGLYAQRPVGDTLTNLNQDRSYFVGPYEWSSDTDLYTWYSCTFEKEIHTLGAGGIYPPEHELAGASYTGNYIQGGQITTSRPLKILGIAACAYMPDMDWPWLGPNPYSIEKYKDTSVANRLTDSLILYTLTPNGPVRMASGPWRMEYPHRNIVLPPIQTDQNIGTPDFLDSLLIPVASLYEVMFDSPQVVTDSFIVAGTAKNNTTSPGRNPNNPDAYPYLWDHRPTRYWAIHTMADHDNPDLNTWLWSEYYDQWHKHRWALPDGYGMYYWEFRIIVPIIEPDFDSVLCDMVRDIRVAEATDTTITLMWNGGNAVQWEVEYAEATGTTTYSVTTTSPMVTLTGLRASTTYLGHVRAMCEWDTEYGPWSDLSEMATGAHQQPHTTGITDNLDRFTQLMPNPAREVVTVLSSYRMGRVAVYDLQGRKVLEQQEDDALAATLDISALPAGVYVVAIHTPAGIATKRLVVEK